MIKMRINHDLCDYTMFYQYLGMNHSAKINLDPTLFDYPVLLYCLSTVYNAGTTLNQCWNNGISVHVI